MGFHPVKIDGRVFSGDLSDEACSDIDLSSGELAKSEAAIQDSLVRRARNNQIQFGLR